MQLTVEGHSVYIGTAGSTQADATAPVVVFVHGAGFDQSVWVMQSRYFARQGYRVIAPDLPAHGKSAGNALASIDQMADWLAALLDTLNVASACVVGHSMGSLAAFAFAHRHPQLVRGVALLGTAAPMPVTNLLLDAAQDNDAAAFVMANTWSHSAAGRRGAVGNPGSWVFGAAQSMLERNQPGVYYADLAACNRFDPASYTGTLECPVLVVTGEKDQMTPAKAGIAVAQQLPNAKLINIAGSGHAMMSEHPNAVLDALAGFV